MSDITLSTGWGYDKFEGMGEDWLAELAAKCLVYRGEISDWASEVDGTYEQVNRVMLELNDEPNWLLDREHDNFTVEYDGGEYIIATSGHTEYVFTMAVESLLEEAYYELEQIKEKHCCYLNNYLTFDDDMFARDCRHDYDAMVCPYDNQVDEISVAVWDNERREYFKAYNFFMWRID